MNARAIDTLRALCRRLHSCFARRNLKQQLLRPNAQGPHANAQRIEGSVIDLAADTHQHDQGAWRRLCQHIANALFRTGDGGHSSHHDSASRIVQIPVPPAPLQHAHADRAEPKALDVTPVHEPLGQANDQPLVIREGVEGHQNCLAAVHDLFRRTRQRCADDSHDYSPLSESQLSHLQGATVLPDPAAQPPRTNRIPRITPTKPGLFRRLHSGAARVQLKWLQRDLRGQLAATQRDLDQATEEVIRLSRLHQRNPELQSVRQILRAERDALQHRLQAVDTELMDLEAAK